MHAVSGLMMQNTFVSCERNRYTGLAMGKRKCECIQRRMVIALSSGRLGFHVNASNDEPH